MVSFRVVLLSVALAAAVLISAPCQTKPGPQEPATPYLFFIKQPGATQPATTTATLAAGSFTVDSTYGPSGNAFKAVSGVGNYGTNAVGFLAYPRPLTGDFSIRATVTITNKRKSNNTIGVGVGLTTGFQPTDSYAFHLLAGNGTNNTCSVSGIGTTSSGEPNDLKWTLGSSYELVFQRVGTSLKYGAAATGQVPVLTEAPTSQFTNAVVYADGPVYPCLAFTSVVASVTNLVIADKTGTVLFDSATGALVTYVPAALVLAAPQAEVTKDGTTTVTVVANAPGGTVSAVTAVSSDPAVEVSVANGPGGSVLTLRGVGSGTALVTLTNEGDSLASTRTKALKVVVNEYPTTDAYGPLKARTEPAAGSTAAYTDGELRLTFDAPPTLVPGGSVKVYRASDGSLVDSIAFAGEFQFVAAPSGPPVKIGVGDQLARVEGNSLFVTPHFGALAYGTEYYVVVPRGAVKGVINGTEFGGLSDRRTVKTWSFQTRAAPSLTTTVAVGGTHPDFQSLGGALGYLAAHPLAGATAITVNVAAGTYHELVNYRAWVPDPNLTITIAGPANRRGSDCVFTYANGGNVNVQSSRASFYFTGANLVLKNLSLVNSGSRSVYAQAEALYFASGAGSTLAANNCTFTSRQDTVQTSGRAWFYRCDIAGNTDFLWGTSDVALFEDCRLRVVNDAPGSNYSIFVARTAANKDGTLGQGYVLWHSEVTIDDGVTATFARNAGGSGFYDQVAVVANAFTSPGTGKIADSAATKQLLWDFKTPPLGASGHLELVGWKHGENTGLNLGTLANDPGVSAVVTGFASRDQILNRVAVLANGVPTGYQPAAVIWDTAPLAQEFR